jgi:hypothetical protein
VAVSLWKSYTGPRRHPDWERRVDDVLVYRLLVDPPLKTLGRLASEWGCQCGETVRQMEQRILRSPLLEHDPIVQKPTDDEVRWRIACRLEALDLATWRPSVALLQARMAARAVGWQ